MTGFPGAQHRKLQVCLCFDETVRLNALLLCFLLRATCYPATVCVQLVRSSAFPIGEFFALETDHFAVSDLVVAETRFDALASRNISPAAFLRLQLPFLLPRLPRVLYMDVDVVPRRSIAALFRHDMRGHPVAAAPDIALTHYAVAAGLKMSLARGVNVEEGEAIPDYLAGKVGVPIARTAAYFNSGVLVMDLEAMRRGHYESRLRNILAGRSAFVLHDQDILNSIFWDDHASLDLRWNVHANCCDTNYFSSRNLTEHADADIWRSDPWILHFSGPEKPWNSPSATSVHDGEFWMAARRTPVYGRLLASSPRYGVGSRAPRRLLDTSAAALARWLDRRFVS